MLRSIPRRRRLADELRTGKDDNRLTNNVTSGRTATIHDSGRQVGTSEVVSRRQDRRVLLR